MSAKLITSGPWTAKTIENGLASIESPHWHIATVARRSDPEATAANARLIAAAPELLEAVRLLAQRAECRVLNRFADTLGGCGKCDDCNAVKFARTAIAKAEGGEK